MINILLLYSQALRKRHGVITLAEAAQRLDIDQETLFRASATNCLPHLKAMGKFLFERAEIDAWMASLASRCADEVSAMTTDVAMLLPFSAQLRASCQMLTLDEASALLGTEPYLLLRMAARGEAPQVLVFGKYYFGRDSLLAWKARIVSLYMESDKLDACVATTI